MATADLGPILRTRTAARQLVDDLREYARVAEQLRADVAAGNLASLPLLTTMSAAMRAKAYEVEGRAGDLAWSWCLGDDDEEGDSDGE